MCTLTRNNARDAVNRTRRADATRDLAMANFRMLWPFLLLAALTTLTILKLFRSPKPSLRILDAVISCNIMHSSVVG